ncbi:MAG TPA: hypothetical protein VL181_06850 [Holophagaceae bacterium]|nr:hypothetical protein [Holophagaceae bacterium]
MSAVALDGAAFLAAVADASLEGFGHREHLRVAWLCLRESGRGAGGARAAALIKAYAEAKGARSKFDAALTRRWMDRVWAAMEAAPAADFEALLAASPELRA